MWWTRSGIKSSEAENSIDTIQTHWNSLLPAQVENLTLLTGAVGGTGNSHNNILKK